MSTPPKATPTTPQWAEEMLAACIPGGDVCDPQMVADHLRDWLARHAPPPAAPYLKGEPGDSELLDWLLENERAYVGLRGKWNLQKGERRITPLIDRAAIRAAIKSAQRGEGKP